MPDKRKTENTQDFFGDALHDLRARVYEIRREINNEALAAGLPDKSRMAKTEREAFLAADLEGRKQEAAVLRGEISKLMEFVEASEDKNRTAKKRLGAALDLLGEQERIIATLVERLNDLSEGWTEACETVNAIGEILARAGKRKKDLEQAIKQVQEKIADFEENNS